jgi:hypothetical protein
MEAHRRNARELKEDYSGEENVKFPALWMLYSCDKKRVGCARKHNGNPARLLFTRDSLQPQEPSKTGDLQGDWWMVLNLAMIGGGERMYS